MFSHSLLHVAVKRKKYREKAWKFEQKKKNEKLTDASRILNLKRV